VGGQHCDKCLPGYWNMTADGCQSCDCKRDGVAMNNETGGYSCDPLNGHCTCIEGVRGEKCDQCDDRWALVKNVGCKQCDSCVNTLLDEIQLVEQSFNRTEYFYNNLNTSGLNLKLKFIIEHGCEVASELISNSGGIDQIMSAKLFASLSLAAKDLRNLIDLSSTNLTLMINQVKMRDQPSEEVLGQLNALMATYKQLEDLFEDVDRSLTFQEKDISIYRLKSYESVAKRITATGKDKANRAYRRVGSNSSTIFLLTTCKLFFFSKFSILIIP
jgi:hypothetical protein